MFKSFWIPMEIKINKIPTQKQNRSILQQPTADLGWDTSKNVMEESDDVAVHKKVSC